MAHRHTHTSHHSHTHRKPIALKQNKSRTHVVFFLNLLLQLGRGLWIVIGELQRLQLGNLQALSNGEASHFLLELHRFEGGGVLTSHNGVCV